MEIGFRKLYWDPQDLRGPDPACGLCEPARVFLAFNL